MKFNTHHLACECDNKQALHGNTAAYINMPEKHYTELKLYFWL